MRMWMVNPAAMCDKDLLGEHAECHMLVGHLKRKRRITDYIRLNLPQPGSLRERHEQLASEINNGGTLHRSPLPDFDLSYLPGEHRTHMVNTDESLAELSERCSECGERLCVLSDTQEYANMQK